MNRNVSLALGVSIALFPGAASALTTRDGRASDTAAVEKVERLVANAPTPELGLSCYDPSIVQDDFFAPQRRGIAEVAKDFDIYMAHYTSFNADIRDLTIEVQGNLAIAYSHQRFTAKGKAGGRHSMRSFARPTSSASAMASG